VNLALAVNKGRKNSMEPIRAVGIAVFLLVLFAPSVFAQGSPGTN
jgi:hypothetical protein